MPQIHHPRPLPAHQQLDVRVQQEHPVFEPVRHRAPLVEGEGAGGLGGHGGGDGVVDGGGAGVRGDGVGQRDGEVEGEQVGEMGGVAQGRCCDGDVLFGGWGGAGFGEVERADGEGEGAGCERVDGVDEGEVFTDAADLAGQAQLRGLLARLLGGREVLLCAFELLSGSRFGFCTCLHGFAAGGEAALEVIVPLSRGLDLPAAG